MRKIKRLLITLMTAVLLVSIAAPAAYAASDGALNGESGSWSQFDETVYDAVGFISDAKNDKFDWPSSGTVLLKENSSTYTLAGSKPNCIGITIPAGLKVDIYKYSGGSDTYTLLGHFDTTDGKSVTISAGSTSGNTGNSNSTTSGSTSSTAKKEWNDVKKTFTPRVTSDTYSNSYIDVPETMWCYNAIMSMTDGGLLAGYGNGKFGPNDPLTRAQVSIIFTRTLGNTPGGNGDLLGYASYKDNAVASRAFAAIWFAGRLENRGGKVFLTSNELSLVENSGGLIANRVGQVASMYQPVYDCWRASLNAGKDPATYITSLDELPDGDEIRQWIAENWELMSKVLLIQHGEDIVTEACENAILRAYNLGLIGGVDDKGTFDPYGNLTRGQMAQICWNMGWTEAGCLSYR